MTPQERAAKAQRAQMALDEFLFPALQELRNAYSERLVDVANAELARDKRADKITALSNALRIVEQVKASIDAIVLDGEVARRDIDHASRVEGMTAPQRRLLGMAPGFGFAPR